MKINGIEIKSMKTFKGHEGETLAQGNIYLNGKKQGFWSMDSWSGEDIYEFDKSVLQKACDDFRDGFPDGYRYKDFCNSPDILLNEIVIGLGIEKQFRKAKNKGYSAIVYITDGFHESYLFCPTSENIDETYKDDIDKLKAKMFKSGYVTHTFKSKDEFNITIDSQNPSPEYMVKSW